MMVKRRTARTIAASTLFVVGALIASLAPGAASTGTQLTAGGGSGVESGSSFVTTVSVTLAAQDELNAFDVTLTHDPSVAVPTSIALNPAWIIPLDDGTITPGTIHVAASRLGFCTGTCPLFTITWNPVAAGSFTQGPSAYVLSGRENGAGGNLNGTSAGSGSISVTGSSQPTNTPTNTPVTAPTNTTQPTNTPVTPATNTPVPTSTPISTPTQPETPAGTTSPTTPASTVPPSTPEPGAAAPIVITTPTAQPADPEPDAVSSTPPPSQPSQPAVPTASAPRPVTTTNSGSGVAAGTVVPLPPQTGSGTNQPVAFPWRPLGWAMMAIATGLGAAEFARGRKNRARNFSRHLDRYFDDLESRDRGPRG